VELFGSKLAYTLLTFSSIRYNQDYLDSVLFVIRIQRKTAGHGIRIGLRRSELQIFTPADARRFPEEERDSKQVNVETLLKWISLTSTSIVPRRSNGDRRQVRSQDRNPVIRVYDAAGNVIETREHKGNFKAR